MCVRSDVTGAVTKLDAEREAGKRVATPKKDLSAPTGSEFIGVVKQNHIGKHMRSTRRHQRVPQLNRPIHYQPQVGAQTVPPPPPHPLRSLMLSFLN